MARRGRGAARNPAIALMLRHLFTLNVTTAATMRHRFHRRLSEWHLALLMFVTGLVLASTDAFVLESFAAIEQIATQPIWSTTMASIGGLRIAVLTVNGALGRRSPHLRALLAFISIIIWSFLLAGLVQSSTPLLIGPFIAMAIAVDMINAFRASQDARREDDANGGANGLSG